MRFAVIENGAVTNIIEAEDGFAPAQGQVVSDAEGLARIGGAWSQADGFSDPPEPVASDDDQRRRRAAAFQAEADPLFFKVQRGEADLAEWQAKIAEIRARFPYAESA